MDPPRRPRLRNADVLPPREPSDAPFTSSAGVCDPANTARAGVGESPNEATADLQRQGSVGEALVHGYNGCSTGETTGSGTYADQGRGSVRGIARTPRPGGSSRPGAVRRAG